MKNHDNTTVVARSEATWQSPVKKITALMLCLICIVSVFTGCHGAQERKAFVVPEAFDTSRTYEITFWAKNDTNLTQANIYRQAIADFEALYPNIKVKLKLYTDYGRIYQDVITNISTDTTPNVCITYPDHIATYKQGAEVVVALDDLFTDKQYGLGGSEVLFDSPELSEIVPQFLSECKLEGYYYAIPYMRSTEACYVNKTYVEKLGFTLPDMLTWDFVYEVSMAAMEKDADGTFQLNGQNTLIPFIYKSTDNMMIQMLRQLDAGYSTQKGEIEIFNDATRDIMLDIAALTEKGAFSTFKITGYPGNFFNAGQCIFAVDSTAGASWIGSDAPHMDIPEDKLAQFETVVMEIPQYDTQNPKMISQGPSLCVFNKEDPQEVLASWLFAQYMLTNTVQIAYAQTEGYIPVTTKAQQSAEYQDYLSRAGENNELYYQIKMDATNLLLDNIGNTFTTPVFNGSASLRDAAGSLIESTVRTIRRKETVDEQRVQDIYAEATSLYRLDQIQTDGEWKLDLGPLPRTSVILLGTLCAVWVIIAISAVIRKGKVRKV